MGGIVIAKFLVKFFRVNWITKMYQKRNFSSGRAESAPPLPLVGLSMYVTMKTFRAIIAGYLRYHFTVQFR